MANGKPKGETMKSKKQDWIKTIRFGSEIGRAIDAQRNKTTGENFSDAVRRMCNEWLLLQAIKPEQIKREV